MSKNSAQAAVNPGDYPLGSERSRAVARQLLEHKWAGAKRFELILSVGSEEEPHAEEWTQTENGELTRMVSLPGGVSMEACLRKLGGYSEEEIRVASERHPLVPHCEIMRFDRQDFARVPEIGLRTPFSGGAC
jgi:hypothetical protein